MDFSKTVQDWGETIIYLLVIVIALGTIWFKWDEWFPRADKDRSTPVPGSEGQDGRKTSPSPRPKKYWWQKEEWWTENEFFVILGIILFHVVIGTAWPGWWREKIGSSGKMLVLQGILIYYATLVPTGNKPFHHKLGQMGVPFVIMVMLILLFVKQPQVDPTAPTTGIAGERIYSMPAAPEWSVKINTPGTTWYNPEGPGKLQVNADEPTQVTVDIDLNKGVWPTAQDGKPLRANTIRFQSSTGKAMRVAVAK